MTVLGKRGVMRNVLIEAKPGKPAPSQMHTQLLDQLAFTGDAVQVRIGAKRSAEANVSYLPFDTCRAEIYRRQRNSCWSRCTRATSPADHPARKLPSPDRPEHRPRSQCTR